MIFSYAHLNTHLALVQVAVRHPRKFIELRKVFSTLQPLQTFAVISQNIPGYQRFTTKVAKWYIFEVFFVDLHLFSTAAATASTAGLPTPAAGGGTVFGVAPAAEELDVVGDDVDFRALGTVLGFPCTVLQAPFEEDGIPLLLVVGDGLAQLTPGGDVEKVYLFAARPHPVDREPE
jgi:hypothetical protein